MLPAALILYGIIFKTESVSAQSPATVREYTKTYTTYPFSDPDPVPDLTNMYPYFRYDGFTDQPVEKAWKIVALENDFIKVLITPQIGGKIWTAINKQNNQPFIYNNDVVKFRDIAMRGPWTSGGIEINYGMFGHTPGVATPVNYLMKKNKDSSASCILSLLDLLTGTRWSLEVRLPKDKAYFITKSTWHNGTGMYQPYYTWMNMAGKVDDRLEYIYPGNHFIGHDGSVHSWPYNTKAGKNISIYNQNNFGGAKSYHVTGVYSKYFGAYWKKENYGMIHYALRQDKIGKKIFIWGLAGSGMIWKKILTDHAGQYTEMQSGRLYNQNAPSSVNSPFKQFYFMPYNTDTWKEYWYPFQNTNGVTAADLNGVFNLQRNHSTTTLFISPVSYLKDTLKIFGTKGKLLFRKYVSLQPLKTFRQNIPVVPNDQIGTIQLAGSVIDLQDSTDKILDRPLKTDSAFDLNSAYGSYLKGQYASGTRHYNEAVRYIRSSLNKNPYFIPALVEMSYLQYRQMNYDSAFYYARKALSMDTYDPATNYYYGMAALKLNKRYDALDGFQVATITPQFRSAAYTQLSRMKIQKQQYKTAYRYASDALTNNTKNVTALQLQYLSARLMGNNKGLQIIREKILQIDPLNHFMRFENYLQHKSVADKRRFTGLIRDELPEQTYLHLAMWYFNLGRTKESKVILKTCPDKNDEINYWLAYLCRDDADAKKWLNAADNGDAYLVFPYRVESAQIMQWAMQQTDNWKPRYYLALIEKTHQHKNKALNILNAIHTKVPFAPFYVIRAQLRNTSDTDNILKDYQTAVSIDGKDWRYGKYLTDYFLSFHQDKKALTNIETYYKNNPENYITGLLYVHCLMLNNRYSTAEKVLRSLHILPYEGATRGHQYFKQIKLMLALQLLQRHQYEAALQKVADSRKWPEHLGVGKPYPDGINDSLQNEIEQLILKSEQSHDVSTEKIRTLKTKIQAKL